MIPILLRRKRTLFILAAAVFALCLFLSQRPGSLHIPQEKLAEESDEIYGLIHLVVSGDDVHHDLSHNAINPSQPVHLSAYAKGRVDDWRNEIPRLNTDYPIIIFGERYCPFSRRVRKVLSMYQIAPKPYNVELDMRKDSRTVRTILTRLTGRATLPNILVRGRSIGGSDELLALHHSQRLEQILREAGAVVIATGEEDTSIL